MSITFWMPQAPEIRVAPYPEEPDYFEVRPAAPFTDINMSNSNAKALLELVNPGADTVCGEWYSREIADMRRRIMVLLNTTPEDFTIEACVEGRCYTGGRDMDYVTRRLTDFLVLLTVATANDFHVVYG